MYIINGENKIELRQKVPILAQLAYENVTDRDGLRYILPLPVYVMSFIAFGAVLHTTPAGRSCIIFTGPPWLLRVSDDSWHDTSL